MTELLEMTRKNRCGAAGHVGGFPCGNMIAAANGARFRQSIRHQNVTFMQASGRR
ncbi:MAG: hypothetical protein U1E48_13320 [Paracoccaceae bacterium]